MGSEAPESPSSQGKHRLSPAGDEGGEEASKRRKHHHHHHRRHHHRRHSKHGRDRDVCEDLPPVAIAEAEAEAGSSVPQRPVDDEPEEGEILDGEEEGGNHGGRRRASLEAERGSDVESGEIEPEAMDPNLNLATARENDTSSVKSLKVLNHCENTSLVGSLSEKAQKSVNAESSNLPHCYPSGKEDAYEVFGDPIVGKMEDSNIVNERDMSKNNGVTEERFNRETSIPEFENLALNDEGNKTGPDGEARRRPSKLHVKGTEKDKYRHADLNDSKSRARSSSPIPGESSHLPKHRGLDDHETRDSDLNLEKLDSRRQLELWDVNRKASDRRNKSISPKSLRDKYKDIRYSPEIPHRDRSRSRDHKREKSYGRDLEPYVDACTRVNHFDSQVTRSDSDRERDVRHDKVDRYMVRPRDNDKVIRRERESSSSYSRHDQREDRHGSRDRYSERDRYTSGVKDGDSMVLDKGVHRESERSSSYIRRDGRDDRHESWDKDRGRERYTSSGRDKDREKRRDISRERYRDRERQRGTNRERDRVEDGNDRDNRNWARPSEYRERVEQMERDRITIQDRHRNSRHSRYDEMESRKERTRLKDFANEDSSNKRNAEANKEETMREENEEVYQERIEEQLAKQDEEDADKIKEESRKRRQAILEKYKQQQMQQHVKSPSTDNEKEEHASKDEDNLEELNASSAISKSLHEELENRHDTADVYVVDPSFTVGKSPMRNGEPTTEKTDGAGGLGDGTPKSERSTDMFCDDIFGESPAGVRKSGKGDGLQIDRSGLHDNWDDAEGYYSYRFGEVLDGRFEVIAAHGKGVFSTVVRARDLKAGKDDPEEVAIKIIRNNDTMYKAGLEELVILKKLAGADPEDKRHCVRFLSNFKYRNHLCLVFESLHMNLREVLKKFGRNIGLKLTAVRAYAKQLFIALKHLRNCGVLHCDIKPDNMLVNEAKNVLKVCDFGNAMFAGKNEITPYLVSRFYRAPEIILGLPYDHPLDIWSVGCCLYELYTGKVLFPGPSNNDMLRLHMELKGPFPKKMLRKGAFTDQHFDQDLNFHATEEDLVTKKTVKRLLLNIKPKDIGTLISSFPGEDPKMLANFKDLLERIFILDPEKRMTVSQALGHPFITGK